MGWEIGYDAHWKRDIGYGVPAVCDHPDCSADIDRGLYYVCGGEPFGGADGCGLYFCQRHLSDQRCERCHQHAAPFIAKPDCDEWILFKQTDPSWGPWRRAKREKKNA